MTKEIESKEVAVVKGQATKALTAATELVIKSPEDLSVATDHLSKMKKVAKMIKDRKEEITKPLTLALNSARALFKPIEETLEQAEKVIKDKMLKYQDEQEKARQIEQDKITKKIEDGKMGTETAIKKMENLPEVQTSASGKVGQIQTRIVKKYRVTDESKLPREFLIPDMAKITEALKAGREVPGAETYEEKVIAAR